jgi:hypothetical protein
MPPPNKQMKNNNPTNPNQPPSPPPNVNQVQDQLKTAREAFVGQFLEFRKALHDKKLVSNKSPLEKQADQDVIGHLRSAAQQLDLVNAGEGAIVLAGALAQELLALRNRLNEVEYTSLLTRKELNDLKASLGEEKK